MHVGNYDDCDVPDVDVTLQALCSERSAFG